MASVHAVLASFPTPWLLIFDNAADLASVAGFLPPAGLGLDPQTGFNDRPPGGLETAQAQFDNLTIK